MLHFDIRDYNSLDTRDAQERDDIPNSFNKLSLEELLLIRENKYLLSKKNLIIWKNRSN